MHKAKISARLTLERRSSGVMEVAVAEGRWAAVAGKGEESGTVVR